MYAEDELLPISALQHLLFCERQCALIHIEGAWAENRFTAEGRQLHDRAHSGADESRCGVRIARGAPLRSLRLGLTGVADVIEFRRADGGAPTPFPVEYKRGKPKRNDCDRVQLCAQALCLEEMLQVAVPAGALFYGRPRRRTDVAFDDALRRKTEDAAERLHALLCAGAAPPVAPQLKCRRCSLANICMPNATSPRRSAAQYMRRALRDADAAVNEEERSA